MDEQLKNLKFSTKPIMITDKQKEFIETNYSTTFTSKGV